MKKLVSYSLLMACLCTGTINPHVALIHGVPAKKSVAPAQPHPRSQTRPGKIKLMPIDPAWTAKVATLLGLPSNVANSPNLDLVDYALNKKINFNTIQFGTLNAMLQNASLTFQRPTRGTRSPLSLKLGINFGGEVMPTSVFENMIKLIMCASISNADKIFFQGNQSDAVEHAALTVPLESIQANYSPAFESFTTTLLNKLASPMLMKTASSFVGVINTFAPENSAVKKMVNGINSINTALLSCSVIFNKNRTLSNKLFNWVVAHNNKALVQGLTPLGYMVIENQPARVLELINKGVDPNASIKHRDSTESLLSLAIRSGSHEAAKVLIESKNINLVAPAQEDAGSKTCLDLLNETIARIKSTATKRNVAAPTELEQYENLRTLYMQKLVSAKR